MANCGRMVRDRAMVTKESLYMQLYSSNDRSRNKTRSQAAARIDDRTALQ